MDEDDYGKFRLERVNQTNPYLVKVSARILRWNCEHNFQLQIAKIISVFEIELIDYLSMHHKLFYKFQRHFIRVEPLLTLYQVNTNSCITCVQCWTNVEDVGPTLYTCYANVLGVLGTQVAALNWSYFHSLGGVSCNSQFPTCTVNANFEIQYPSVIIIPFFIEIDHVRNAYLCH